MTYQTKRQLRKALANERQHRQAVQDGIADAGLGLEESWGTRPTGETFYEARVVDWRAEKAAAAEVRREVLEKVIDALELNEYRKKPSLEALFAAAGTTGTKPGVDRFTEEGGEEVSITTVNRCDITLKERVLYRQEGLFDDAVRTPLSSTWVARLDGPLSTGEYVEMTRSANTSSEALADLEAAIAENGWEIQ